MKAKILRRKWFCLSEKESSEDRVFLRQEGSLEEDIVKRRMAREGEKGTRLGDDTEIYREARQTAFLRDQNTQEGRHRSLLP